MSEIVELWQLFDKKWPGAAVEKTVETVEYRTAYLYLWQSVKTEDIEIPNFSCKNDWKFSRIDIKQHKFIFINTLLGLGRENDKM